jgi:hypothetical protein
MHRIAFPVLLAKNPNHAIYARCKVKHPWDTHNEQ